MTIFSSTVNTAIATLIRVGHPLALLRSLGSIVNGIQRMTFVRVLLLHLTQCILRTMFLCADLFTGFLFHSLQLLELCKWELSSFYFIDATRRKKLSHNGSDALWILQATKKKESEAPSFCLEKRKEKVTPPTIWNMVSE